MDTTCEHFFRLTAALTLLSLFWATAARAAPSKPFAPPSVDEILASVRATAAEVDIQSQVTDWHSYKYDSRNGRSIRDGGEDMFDNGNMVSFSVNGNSYFESGGATYNETYDYDDYSFTTIATHPFMALLWVGGYDVGHMESMIQVQGNAGADNHGEITGKEMPTTNWSGYKLQFAFSQVSHSARDPSICEVYFVLSSEERWDSEIMEKAHLQHGDETNILESSYHVTGHNYLLGYVLLSRRQAEPVSEATISDVIGGLAARLTSEISSLLEIVPAGTTSAQTTVADTTHQPTTTTYTQPFTPRPTTAVAGTTTQVTTTGNDAAAVSGTSTTTTTTTTQGSTLSETTEKLSAPQQTTYSSVETTQSADAVPARNFNQEESFYSTTGNDVEQYNPTTEEEIIEHTRPYDQQQNRTTTGRTLPPTDVQPVAQTTEEATFSSDEETLPPPDDQSTEITNKYNMENADIKPTQQPQHYHYTEYRNKENVSMPERETTTTEQYEYMEKAVEETMTERNDYMEEPVEVITNTEQYDDMERSVEKTTTEHYEFIENPVENITTEPYEFIEKPVENITTEHHDYMEEPAEETTTGHYEYTEESVENITTEHHDYMEKSDAEIATEQYDTDNANNQTEIFGLTNSTTQSSNKQTIKSSSNQTVVTPSDDYVIIPSQLREEPANNGTMQPTHKQTTEPPHVITTGQPEDEGVQTTYESTAQPLLADTTEQLNNESLGSNDPTNYVNEVLHQLPNGTYVPLTRKVIFWELVQTINTTTTGRIRDSIQRFYRYNYDGGSDSIHDGGQDMYDIGNMVKFTVDDGPEIAVRYNEYYYGDNYMFASATGHPFFAIAFTDLDSTHRYNLTVHGNAGADGDGRVFFWQRNITERSCFIQYNVFQLSLSADTDPSICEVYFTVSCKEWNSVLNGSQFLYMDDGNELRSQYIVSGTRVLIGYMLLSKPLGSPIRNPDIETSVRLLVRDLNYKESRASKPKSNEVDEVELEVEMEPMNQFETTVADGTNRQAVVQKILHAIEEKTSKLMRSFIPNFYNYYYDSVNGNSIADGGNDMYDGGNMVYFGRNITDFGGSTLVNYNRIYNGSDYAYGTVSSHPFTAIMWMNSSTNDNSATYSLEVRGNAGADHAGDIDRTQGTISLGNYGMDYFVYQISQASNDPSICEIYFVVHSEAWGSNGHHTTEYSHTQGSENLWGVLKATGDKLLLGYTLLSRENGGKIQEAEIKAALRPLLLEIATVSSHEPVLTAQAPEGDYLISPTCLLSEVTSQFYKQCLYDGAWFVPKKFNGVDGCRSELRKVFGCAERILMDCSWSINSNISFTLDIRTVQEMFRLLASPISVESSVVDVFCYHAPLGLDFPFPTEDFLYGACDDGVTDDIRGHLAQFYRSYVWARDNMDIYGAYTRAESKFIELIGSSCSFHGLSTLYPDIDVDELNKFLQVFEKSLRNMKNEQA